MKLPSGVVSVVRGAIVTAAIAGSGCGGAALHTAQARPVTVSVSVVATDSIATNTNAPPRVTPPPTPEPEPETVLYEPDYAAACGRG